MKTELWNGHEIRFVEIEGEWWAVAKDVADALGYTNSRKAIKDHVDTVDTNTVTIRYGNKGNPNQTVVNEFGIYSLIFSSKLESAKEFRRWVFDTIQELRKQSGLEGFRVFRMLDKEHQKEMMRMIKEAVEPNGRIPYMKANTIANKAVSLKHGHKKMVKKEDMTPQMLIDRQIILDSVVNLMIQVDTFDLDISVSEAVYKKFS